MIRHGTGSAHPALKGKRIDVAEFLIAQQCRHAQCFDTGLDGIYVTGILRAKNIDVRCYSLLADAVAHPRFLTAAVGEGDGGLRHACDRMTDANTEKAVTVGRDQPPAVVDSLGVEGPCLFALDVEESAVLIERDMALLNPGSPSELAIGLRRDSMRWLR